MLRLNRLWIAAAALTLAAGAARAQNLDAPVRFLSNAVNMNAGRAGTVEIVIDRWSNDAEQSKLMTTMMEKGPEKLLDVLQDLPRVGFFRTPGTLGLDIRFAKQVPGKDGGHRVIIFTDRRIGFWEAANQPRTIDYPFTYIELRINDDGEGEGKIQLATKIIADPENKIVTLENWDIQPVMLNNVRVERASR
jgi:hypothetical protein